MHKLLSFFLILMLPVIALAQYPGYSPVKDAEVFRHKFSEQAALTKSLESDFEQEKHMSLLSEKIISKGKFWFRREQKVRMEYVTPSPYLVIMDADKVSIRSGKKETSVSTGGNRLFKQHSRIISDCVRGTVVTNPDFKVKFYEAPAGYLIEMIPVSKALKEFFSRIVVYADRKSMQVDKVELFEPSGDYSILRFQNRKTNVPLSDSLFHL